MHEVYEIKMLRKELFKSVKQLPVELPLHWKLDIVAFSNKN